MPWRQMLLRGTSVFARCDERGELRADGGRVEIRYKRSGSKAYQAAARNLEPSADSTVHPDSYCGDAEPAAPTKKGAAKKGAAKKTVSKAAAAKAHTPENGAIVVYADGACSGNPGPAGLGVVVVDGDAREELSEYLGRGTNNIAELTGILRAAEKLREREAPIRIYTDSKYSIGVLTKGWKA
ncbi:MAG: ribonuclease HI, partial [Myxococcales bacterium]|nr:ribonuclease HI [Myxococcales bacterium]